MAYQAKDDRTSMGMTMMLGQGETGYCGECIAVNTEAGRTVGLNQLPKL